MHSSSEAEGTVLGTVMAKPHLWPAVAGRLVPADFYDGMNREIFGAVAALGASGKDPDAVAVMEVLRSRGQGADCATRLATLVVDYQSEVSLENSVLIVREMSGRRAIVDACREVAASRQSSTQMAARLDEALQDSRRGQDMPKHISETLVLAEEHLKQAMATRAAGGIVGAPVGLPGVDHRIGGICESRLYIVAGRPGIGKTALLNQFAFGASSRGFGGAIFTLEMTASELLIRAAAASTQRNVTRMFRGVKDDCEAAFGELAKVSDLPLWINESIDDIDAIVGAIAMLKRKHGIRWAIVDHIGLVRGTADNRVELLDEITRKLKKAAKKHSVGIVAASQLSRGVEKDSRKPQLSDLRESGGIEQNADCCVFLHAESEPQDGECAVAIGILKNRNGPKGWCSEKFRFNGKTQQFFEISEYRAAPLHEPAEVAI